MCQIGAGHKTGDKGDCVSNSRTGLRGLWRRLAQVRPVGIPTTRRRIVAGLLAAALTALIVPSQLLAAVGDSYVRTTTPQSGEKYLLVSDVTNYPLSGPGYVRAPTALGSVQMNGLMIGTRDFALSGSTLRSTANLDSWEFTIASSGGSDGGNQGYFIQRGASYLNLMQDAMDLYDPLGFTITLGTSNVTHRDFVSLPFSVLTGTPRVWYWDGARFYTYYTSDTASVGQYVTVNPSWPGYYRSTPIGWVWVDWNTTPSPGGVSNFTNAKFYLAGVRPGPDTLWDPNSSVWPYIGTLGQSLTAAQNYFAGNVAVAASAVQGTGQLPDSSGLNPPSVEVRNISLYEEFVDTTPPVISGVPSDRIVEATGPSGALVGWSAPTADDAVDGAVGTVAAPASGSRFPLGETTVTVSAADAAGNTSTAQFKVTVRDTTGPSISGVPADMVVEATGASGAAVNWAAPSADDLVDGTVAHVSSTASGSTFPLGETTVTITATDTAGNSSNRSFRITVVDTTSPSINALPLDLVAEATGPDGAVVSWGLVDAEDIVDGTIPALATPSSGSTFPLGETLVSVTATDAAANATAAQFKVTVRDTTAPLISGTPSDMVIEATGPGGAVATWTAASAEDLVDGSVAPVASVASGSMFPIGDTIVDITATDAAGNASKTQFKVRVIDTIAPQITGVPSDRLAEATGPDGAVVNWTAPSAVDVVDGASAPRPSIASGSIFPIGETTVTVTATDTAGNSSTAQFKVTVRDTTGPSISGVPANKRLVATGADGAVVSWTAPTATDAVDGTLTPLSSRSSGSKFPLGDTIVSVTATDSAGNASRAQFTVTVVPRRFAKVGTVYFGFNSYTLTASAKRVLRTHARTIAARDYSYVSVRGYTSGGAGGTWASRNRLSSRRAQAVRTYLAAQLRLLGAAPRITAVGYGAANPAATNMTAAGRAKNRRAEIWAK